jgi:glutamate-5-semialdehyde dehydrogenase
MIEKIGRQAREAARVVATASTATKNDALEAMAASLEASAEEILAANAGDVAQAQTLEIGDALMDRLTLTDARLASMAAGGDTDRIWKPRHFPQPGGH